jgi:outer membrane immunogenic protein
MFKKLLLATAAIVVFGAPAMAADIVEAPVAVPSWTAFYIGGGIGAAWSDFSTGGKYCYVEEDGDEFCDRENQYDSYGYYFDQLFNDDDDTSFRGIAQLGFDYELAPGFVLGAFGDVNFGQETGISGRQDYNYDEEVFDRFDKFSYGVNSLWTLGGRAGFGTENALFYGLVGYSWADAEAKLRIGCIDGEGCWASAKKDDTLNGWTFGGGIEFKGWLWDGFSTAIEYRYTDLDSVTAKGWFEDSEYWKAKVDQDIQQVNLIVKYRFGGEM